MPIFINNVTKLLHFIPYHLKLAKIIFIRLYSYMKISAISGQNNNTNFKSTFPVAIWIRESNGSFAPEAAKEVLEPLEGKLITILNNSLMTKRKAKDLKKALRNKEKSENNVKNKLTAVMDFASQKFRAYICSCDPDYRNARGTYKVRSFYNKIQSKIRNPYTVLYMITGGHAVEFDNRYGKEKGIQDRLANELKAELLKKLHLQYKEDYNAGNIMEETEKYYRQEAEKIKNMQTEGQKAARKKYNNEGLAYVNNYNRRIKDENGATQVLHVKFEIERDCAGEFIDYKFLDARFLPEFGANSPFEKLKRWIT